MAELVGNASEITNIKKESPGRLRAALDFIVNTYFRDVSVEGRGNLAKLPGEAKIVFAVDHITDADMPVAAAVLAKEFDIVITDLSIHRNPLLALKSSDPTYGGIIIAGRDNFSPIEYTQEKGVRAGRINPEDLDKIRKRLSEGKAVVIAAHNPNFNNQLPPKPGFVAARIGQSVDGAVVVPVAVNTDRRGSTYGFQDLVDRRKAHIYIGAPLILDDPEAKAAGDRIEEMFRKPEMTENDRKEIIRLRPKFYRDGEKIMAALAENLPPVKQGKWRRE